MLNIVNNDKNIVETNFWNMPMFQDRFFISFNAGACRILLPPCYEKDLADMKAAKQIVISYGLGSGAMSTTPMYEVMFDDESSCPYCLHSLSGAADRSVSASDHGRKIELSIWLPKPNTGKMQARCVFRRKAFIRTPVSIPCLKPWRG